MPNGKDIKALTGIRGIAAAWVVVYHVHLQANWPSLIGRFVRHGYLAVDVFFVLSGFVMAMSYQAYFRNGFSRGRYLVFLIRRMARVYPLYIGTVVGIALLCAVHASHVWTFNWPDLIANVFLVSAWGVGLDINQPAWSISTEFAAYLSFPWLVGAAASHRRRMPVAMVTLAIAALWWVSSLPTPPTEDRNGPLDVTWEWTFYPVIRCLAGFSLGLVAYQAACLPKVMQWAGQPRIAFAVTTVLVVSACIPGSDLVFVAIVPLLIICLAEGRGVIVRAFALPPVYLLGEISYAMYLVHIHLFRVREAAEAHLSAICTSDEAYYLSYAIYYMVLLVVSYSLFRLYETPMRRLVRRLERRLSPPGEAAVAASEDEGMSALAAPPYSVSE